MSIPAIAVRRGVATSMLMLGLVLLGLAALQLLHIDMLPEIEPPVISVVTLYPGGTALDVETEVTKRLEDKLSSINNLDTLTSVSKDNLSLITLKFDWGTDLAEAANDIRDRVGLVRRELPEDVEDPIIFKFNSADFPVAVVMVTAGESYRDLYRIVDKQIVDELRRVPGVGEVAVRGGLRRQINVYVDRTQLERLRLTPKQVEEALARENITMPAGELKHGFTQVKVRVPGRFQSIEDVRSVVLGVVHGSLVRLGDVAVVEDGFCEPTEYVWGDGREAVVLIIRKQSGQNTTEVCRRLREAFEGLQGRLPADVRINMLIDNSQTIVSNVRNLTRTLLSGGALVMLITWLFLAQLRASVIIGLTIPISLISVFVGMYVLGYTINVISLVSLTIAIGMVVDNAIVVLENITRHWGKMGDGEAASVKGALEVNSAIFASTLTTIIVFIPLLFSTGVVSILFKQLAVIVSLTLGMSWLVSVTMTPMLAARLLGRARRVSRMEERWLGWQERVARGYGRLLTWALRHRVLTVVMGVGVFGVSVYTARFLGSEFIPEVDSGELRVTVEFDEDTRVEETARIAGPFNGYMVSNVPERTGYYLVVGESREGFASAAGQREGPNVARGGAKLVARDQRRRAAKEVAAGLRDFMGRVPGVKRLSVSATSFIQQLFFSAGGGKPVVVEIQGPVLEQLTNVAGQIEGEMRKIAGCVDVTVDQPEYRRELWVEVDRARAAALGVSMASVAETVRSLFYGADATEYFDGGDNFDIHLRLPREQRVEVEDIAEVTVPSYLGEAKPVKLINVARVVEEVGPNEIKRKNRQRIVRVEADVYRRSLSEVIGDVKKFTDQMTLPLGVTVGFGGEREEQVKSFRTLFFLLILGIVLVYMVMAGQFESYRDPFVIMFAVPFALTGAIWFLLLTGNRLNVMSFIGVIMLVGVVVNNAIVLVDYTNQLRRGGMDLFTAVREAGQTRLRPVLMTTLTTVFGLVPMAFSTGEGSETWRPLGATVVGGLSVSTLVTLVLVPVLYTLFERPRHERGNVG
ncbi:MAG: efflux RND transporter permease subunit [bacterium]|nr:efflux RND transporter permease subunit [bacterium]